MRAHRGRVACIHGECGARAQGELDVCLGRAHGVRGVCRMCEAYRGEGTLHSGAGRGDGARGWDSERPVEF